MDVPDVSFKVELEDFEAKRGALLPVGSEGGIRDGENFFFYKIPPESFRRDRRGCCFYLKAGAG